MSVPHSEVMDEYEDIETPMTILPGVDLTFWSAFAVLLVIALIVATLGLALP
jgi:hypothetical protein